MVIAQSFGLDEALRLLPVGSDVCAQRVLDSEPAFLRTPDHIRRFTILQPEAMVNYWSHPDRALEMPFRLIIRLLARDQANGPRRMCQLIEARAESRIANGSRCVGDWDWADDGAMQDDLLNIITLRPLANLSPTSGNG